MTFDKAATEHVAALTRHFAAWLADSFEATDARLAAMREPLLELDRSRDEARQRLAVLAAELMGGMPAESHVEGDAETTAA